MIYSTHFILWLYAIRHVMRKPAVPLHGQLLAPFQCSTYHGLWYTSCGALAGVRNSSMDSTNGIYPMTHNTIRIFSSKQWQQHLYIYQHMQHIVISGCIRQMDMRKYLNRLIDATSASQIQASLSCTTYYLFSNPFLMSAKNNFQTILYPFLFRQWKPAQ